MKSYSLKGITDEKPLKDNEISTLITIDENKKLIEKNYQPTTRKYGKTLCLFYKNGEPRIVIGPHCKYFNIINFIP
jgi:hypothetical protein